jgi:hypothetical protein
MGNGAALSASVLAPILDSDKPSAGTSDRTISKHAHLTVLKKGGLLLLPNTSPWGDAFFRGGFVTLEVGLKGRITPAPIAEPRKINEGWNGKSGNSGLGRKWGRMRRVLVVTQICELWTDWFEDHAWECVAAVWVRNEHEAGHRLGH